MNQRKILIIDDEDVICKACEMVLHEEGFVCDRSLSGAKGLEMALNHSYDLVLLDMKLKDMNGMEILETIKTDKPELCVIVITGYSTVNNTVKAMKLGAKDYLSKPFNEESLINAVKKVFKD